LPQHFPNKVCLNSYSCDFLKRNFGMTVAENFVLERHGRVANLTRLGPPHIMPSPLWYAHARILAVQCGWTPRLSQDVRGPTYNVLTSPRDPVRFFHNGRSS